MPIPHHIHQTWKNNYVPAHLAKYVQSWRREHPNFQHYFWTDELAARFVHRYQRWFLPYFERYSSDVMRADALRYMLLYEYGGIYADLDYECYHSFLPLTRSTDLLLGWEWFGVPDQAKGRIVTQALPILNEWSRSGNTLGNAVMASRARHPLWQAVIKRLAQQHPGSASQPNRAIWYLTGPAFLTRVVLDTIRADWNVLFLDQPSLYPIAWHPPSLDDGYRSSDYPSAFGAHHWAGTWWQPQPLSTRPPILMQSKPAVCRRKLGVIS
jgi:mannosyltransferase OCH1-like enzyme